MDIAQRTEVQRRLENMVLSLNHTQVADFLRKDLAPNNLGFPELESDLDALQLLGQRLAMADLSTVPGPVLLDSLSAHDRLADSLTAIRDYNPVALAERRQSPRPIRDELAARASKELHALFQSSGTLLSFAGLSAKDESALRHAAEAANRSASAVDAIAARVAEKEQAIANLLVAARSSVQHGTVSHHADIFRQEADAHAKAASNWLRAVTWAALGTAALTAANLIAAYFERWTGAGAGLDVVVAKVIAFSVLLSSTVWCGRMYRAHKHNEVVNRHRQHSLSSFDAFAQSSDGDPDVKRAVLIQTSTSIFAPQHSGYATTDSEPTVTSPLIEVMRSLPATK